MATTNKSKNKKVQGNVNKLAIAGFVCSIVGVCPLPAFIPSVLGIIFSAVGLSQIKKTGEEGGGLAIAGILIGALWLAIIMITLMAFITLAILVSLIEIQW
jgi:hypothetical protein